MTIFTLVGVALIAFGWVCCPLLLVWAVYCLTRPGLRLQGALILTSGILAGAVGTLAITLLLSWLDSRRPHPQPLTFWHMALIFAWCFGLGAAAVKAAHLALSVLICHLRGTPIRLTMRWSEPLTGVKKVDG